jgi:hypothetical protein
LQGPIIALSEAQGRDSRCLSDSEKAIYERCEEVQSDGGTNGLELAVATFVQCTSERLSLATGAASHAAQWRHAVRAHEGPIWKPASRARRAEHSRNAPRIGARANN